MPHLIWKRNDTFKEENINSKFLKVKVCTENRASIQYSITQHLRSKMDVKQLLHQVLAGVASLEKVVQQELKEAEERFDQFAKLKELEALDKKNMQKLRESMGDNVKRREKMTRALDEVQRVVQEVVKVKSLLELSMEMVVEEEVKATELPITLQEKLSAWPEVSKLETEEKINKVFKLLEDLGRIFMSMIQV